MSSAHPSQPVLTALYAGSFDPITLGHVDVVRQALKIASHLIIAVGAHAGKTPFMNLDERLALIKKTCQPVAAEMRRTLDVRSYDGLTLDFARQCGASFLVRGLRDATDFDYEMQLAGMNAQLAPDIPSVFFPASPHVRFLSSTLVRQVASMGGDLSPFVPEPVLQALSRE
jgi:pantetheine-phosphate adenylyltransferase